MHADPLRVQALLFPTCYFCSEPEDVDALAHEVMDLVVPKGSSHRDREAKPTVVAPAMSMAQSTVGFVGHLGNHCLSRLFKSPSVISKVPDLNYLLTV